MYSDIEGELLIVRFLLHTVVADFILHILDRSVNRVDSNDSDGVARLFVLFRWDITTAFFDSKLYLEACGGFHMAYFHIRIENLEALQVLVEVACFENVLFFYLETDFFCISIFHLTAEAYLFKVEDYVGHILNHAGQRGELVVYTVNTHRRDGKALER